MATQFKVTTDYKKRVVESFERQEMMNTLKATIHDMQPGEVVLDFPFQSQFTQQHGFIHAGVVSTILDSACGYAAFSLMPEEAAVLTIEFKVNLLSPCKGEWFRAVGRVIKPGRNITVTDAKLYAHTGKKEKLVASMVGTIMAVYDREGVEN